jgi:hypothetical protein
VSVQVHLLGIAEGGEEDVVRSASQREPETVSMSIGGGLLLEMRMEREEEPLRVDKPTKPLTSGAYFRVIAVKGNTYVSHGDFTVGGATSLASFHVPGDDTYDFICFSYNSTSSSSLPTFNPDRGDDISGNGFDLSTNNTNDLLWQKQSVAVGSVDPSLGIKLEHVMVRVKVVLDCSYNGWKIAGVANTMTLGSVFTGGTVGLVSGGVNTSAGSQAIAWPSPSGDKTDHESSPLLVMPKTSGTFTVNIPTEAITRESPFTKIPTGAVSGTFSTALVAGSSYKLYMTLRATRWAGSNIYWDGTAQKLTFDVEGNTTNQGYQGVFFKWGSLVGISPVGDWSDNSTPVYKPGESTSSTYPSWGAIPYWEHNAYGDIINGDHYDDLVGDICQYLSNGDYRLPTRSELGTETADWEDSTPVGGGWVKGGSAASTVGNAAGTYNMIDDGYLYAVNTVMDNATFPATGYRLNNSNELLLVGIRGDFWTSSAASDIRSHNLRFDGDDVRPSDFTSRDSAFAIRCVKN